AHHGPPQLRRDPRAHRADRRAEPHPHHRRRAALQPHARRDAARVLRDALSGGRARRRHHPDDEGDAGARARVRPHAGRGRGGRERVTERSDAEIRARLSQTSVGTLVYVMQAAGIKRCYMSGVAPVTRADALVGRARTLRTIPLREDLQAARKDRPRSSEPNRIAMDQIGEGEVLVIDARRRTDAANLGDVLAQRMATAGAAGVVTAGAVRDLPALEAVGLPVFAGGIAAPTMGTQHLSIEVNAVIA